MEKKMTARTLQAAHTRSKIFDAAISLFKEKGFDAVKIEEICSAAEVSVGLFYNYFSSKDALLSEYLNRVTEAYAELHTKFSEGQTTLDRMRAWAQTNRVALGLNTNDVARFLYAYALRNPDGCFMSDPDRTSHRTVYEIISYGQERGEIRTDFSQDILVHFIEAHFWGCFFAHFIKMDCGLSFDDIIETELKLVYELIRNPGYTAS